ncbi:hypothetical protein QQS21_001377 [Conoideocrella luteorostrata]|uniref:N-acetyltransferase domain-containing protein n=1 Tax=Conoideocrella luteorostrata TaxID=1105319 RepID=A0AAJ0CZX3_9HYPO|nr:hypothetical protein QQS21_001377 [Conoideocrella luteorostrata]
MKIRPATPADIPAVVRVVLSALTDEAPWKAFFPRKAQDDPTYTAYCEAILRSYVEPAQRDDLLFLVAEASGPETKTNSGAVIVAAAIWDTSTGLGQGRGNGRQMSDSEEHDPSLDKAPGKLAALSGATVDGRRKHFSSDVPYVYLHLLATRPDYQRKGYGKALCAWGIKAARQKHASICAQAGSRGYILFSGLGFVDKGHVVLPTEPGSDEVLVKAMMLDSKLVQRRGSIFDSLLRYIVG